MLACVLFAAFADGATGLPQETWLQLALLGLAVFAAGSWLFGGGVRVAASPWGWAGIALLAAFAGWTGLSIAWSVLPDGSWLELNRAIAYVVAALLGVAIGASLREPFSRTARGLALLVAPVALFALGGKTLPGLDLGIADLDHAAGLTRLRAPLDYWNALGLFCVIGVLPALRLAADPSRGVRTRLAALAGVTTFLLVLGLTYSRGGIVALVAGLAVLLVLASEPMRTVALLAGAALLASVPLAVALGRPDLTTNGLPLGRREDDALLVLAAYLVVLGLTLAWGRALIAAERRVPRSAARRWRRRAAWAAGVLVVLGLANAAATGAVGRAVDAFTDTRGAARPTDPDRLLSAGSGNRWTWWKEAAGAWADRPVAGWGAGSFPVTHRRYRKDLLSVRQPHSVPLQWMAETGLVGLALAGGGLLALLAAALARVRSIPRTSRERGAAAALLAVAAAWVVHALYDWDWDIPAVTVPVLVLTGMLAARSPQDESVPPGETALRGPAYAGAVLLLALAAVSAALPALAQSRVSAALDDAGRPEADAARLARAAASAELAAGLNPLSVQPLFAAASVAERRARVDQARRELLRAVERQPHDVEAWFRLARIELARLDVAGVDRAARRALELDPLNPAAIALARRAAQAELPPPASATATGSPLPAATPQPFAPAAPPPPVGPAG